MPRLLHHREDVHRLGAAMQPQATAEELLEGDLAALLKVEELEQVLGLCWLDIDGLPFGCRVRVAEAVLDLAEGDGRLLGPVRHVEELHDLVHEEGVLLLLGALQRRLHEDAGDDVHQSQEREGHVGREGQAQERRDLVDHGADHAVPVGAAGHRLPEGEDRPGERPEKVPEGLLTLGQRVAVYRPLHHVVRDGLGEVHANDVYHQQQQHHCPSQRPEGADDGADNRTELADEVQDADHAEDAHKPKDPKHPQQPEVAHVHAGAPRHDADDLLGELREDDHEVEVVPRALPL
mmetsp:Transcript_88831/g.287673  ORF Transcript_88831/g.287673 Transcript_88831/m.287673 type:complete len:292 (-) Transcript_88831:443-1318(-)